MINRILYSGGVLTPSKYLETVIQGLSTTYLPPTPLGLALWFLQCVEIPVQSKRWES